MRRCARRAVLAIVSAALAASVSGGTAPAQKASPAHTGAVKSAPKPKAQPVWRFSRSAGLATLEFGVPGAGEAVVSFSCQPNSGLVRVVSHIGSRGVRPGDGAAIRLINGKNKFEVAGTAFSAAADAVDIGGSTRIDARLLSVFRGGETVLLDVPGRRRTLPLANARAGAEAFEKACGSEPQTG